MSRVKWATSAAVVFMSVTACAATDLPKPSPYPGLPAPQTPPSAQVYTPSGDFEFDAWRQDFSTRARAAGRDPAIVYGVLEGLSPLPEVKGAALGEDQAEFVKPIWDYVNSATTPSRVSFGKEKLAESVALFDGLEARYAPPREILSSIWGMETSYGRFMGSFDSPRQLATLAYKGRRTKLGEEQLIAVFKLLEQGVVTREQLKVSSWAGAVGQTQFMPATFLAYARDGDGDARKDLWGSSADALASAGNYLGESGWRKGEPWALEVVLPANIDYALADGTKRSVGEWRALGLSIANDRPANDALMAEFFLPAGSYGPAFLLFHNFYVIKTYNNADSYALSVGLLADKLASRPDLTRAWPTDVQMLSKAQVRELQAALNALGYDAGVVDGLAGRRTRSALQGFQKDRRLVADGFPTQGMLQRVTQAVRG